jgi:hypothetical protein
MTTAAAAVIRSTPSLHVVTSGTLTNTIVIDYDDDDGHLPWTFPLPNDRNYAMNSIQNSFTNDGYLPESYTQLNHDYENRWNFENDKDQDNGKISRCEDARVDVNDQGDTYTIIDNDKCESSSPSSSLEDFDMKLEMLRQLLAYMFTGNLNAKKRINQLYNMEMDKTFPGEEHYVARMVSQMIWNDCLETVYLQKMTTPQSILTEMQVCVRKWLTSPVI